jgi:hypothetical protein
MSSSSPTAFRPEAKQAKRQGVMNFYEFLFIKDGGRYFDALTGRVE